MVWKCSICSIFVALTLKLLMRHIFTEHARSLNFQVQCNLEDCSQPGQVYTKYNSYYRHVMRQHSNLLQTHGPRSLTLLRDEESENEFQDSEDNDRISDDQVESTVEAHDKEYPDI